MGWGDLATAAATGHRAGSLDEALAKVACITLPWVIDGGSLRRAAALATCTGRVVGMPGVAAAIGPPRPRRRVDPTSSLSTRATRAPRVDGTMGGRLGGSCGTDVRWTGAGRWSVWGG